MKRVLLVIPVLVLCLGFWLARGDYSYYYSQALYPANWSNWTTYGTVNSSCYSSYCGASGGGLLLSFNWPGEVRLTIARDPAANDFYATYFGATNSVWGTIMGSPPQEVYEPLSYLEDAELNCWGSSGTVWVTQATYDTNNGRVQTSFASANVACSASMTLRAVSRGSQMLVYVNNVLAINYTGIPGGNFGSDVGITLPTTTGSLVTNVDFGYLDTIAPNAIPASSISKSAFVNHVDLSWPAGTDDANGTGVYNYEIWRNGGFLGSTTGLTFSDTTVNPSTTYTYTLKVVDFHGNGANTNFSVTTPYIQTNGPFPSATPEGRRVGVRATGAYWGASGENIDVMSGNLSFALPLVKAQARSGWGVGFNLAYNSQNWRYDSGGNWEFGGDVGYGFGWRLLAGSITPVFSDPYTVSYYLFTDSTGAEYRLDQNSGGIWSSKESIYVYYDPSVTTLHFRDGSFWYFGCISASTEADSGVMYPTIMEDTKCWSTIKPRRGRPGPIPVPGSSALKTFAGMARTRTPSPTTTTLRATLPTLPATSAPARTTPSRT